MLKCLLFFVSYSLSDLIIVLLIANIKKPHKCSHRVLPRTARAVGLGSLIPGRCVAEILCAMV